MLKECSRCGETKPVEAFHRDKTRKDGLQRVCRQCQADYYQEHKSERSTYLKQNKEKIAVCAAKYYQEHKEERAEYDAAYAKANTTRRKMLSQHVWLVIVVKQMKTPLRGTFALTGPKQ